MEREGQIVRNRRGQLLIADKAGLIKGKVIGHPDGFGFLQPDDGDRRPLPGPEADARGAARRHRARARHRRRPQGPARGLDRRSARARQQQGGGPALHRARRDVRDRGEQAHQPGHPHHRPKAPCRREGGTGGRGRDHRAADQECRAHRARDRDPRQLRRPGHGDRDRAAQARPAARVSAGRRARRGEILRGRRGEGPEGPQGPARPRLRHHRRRDGARLRRRGLRRAQGQGLEALGGDRRREPLREARRCPRCRGATSAATRSTSRAA